MSRSLFQRLSSSRLFAACAAGLLLLVGAAVAQSCLDIGARNKLYADTLAGQEPLPAAEGGFCELPLDATTLTDEVCTNAACTCASCSAGAACDCGSGTAAGEFATQGRYGLRAGQPVRNAGRLLGRITGVGNGNRQAYFDGSGWRPGKVLRTLLHNAAARRHARQANRQARRSHRACSR